VVLGRIYCELIAGFGAISPVAAQAVNVDKRHQLVPGQAGWRDFFNAQAGQFFKVVIAPGLPLACPSPHAIAMIGLPAAVFPLSVP
jgi:hypothetical protein